MYDHRWSWPYYKVVNQIRGMIHLKGPPMTKKLVSNSYVIRDNCFIYFCEKCKNIYMHVKIIMLLNQRKAYILHIW